jgi:hypothetical protein
VRPLRTLGNRHVASFLPAANMIAQRRLVVKLAWPRGLAEYKQGGLCKATRFDTAYGLLSMLFERAPLACRDQQGWKPKDVPPPGITGLLQLN